MIHTHRQHIRHIWPLVFLIAILLTSGCTKHYASGLTATSKDQKKADQSVVGIWQLTGVDLPDRGDNLAEYGSIAEKNKNEAMLKTYQSSLKGLVVTFNQDKTYRSEYSGQSDVGTWQFDEKGEIQVLSKVSGQTSVYQIVKREADTLTVKYLSFDGSFLMTFIKK
jgi:hypothetical protein